MSDTIDPTKLKVAELRAELQSRGLDAKGNKPVLVERLREALEQANEEETEDTGDIELDPDHDVQEEEEEDQDALDPDSGHENDPILELETERDFEHEVDHDNEPALELEPEGELDGESEPEPEAEPEKQPESEPACKSASPPRDKELSPVKGESPCATPQKDDAASSDEKDEEPDHKRNEVDKVTVKEETEDEYYKMGYEDAPIQDMSDVKREMGNGYEGSMKSESVYAKEELIEPKQEPSDAEDRRGEKRRAHSRSRSPDSKKQRPEVEEVRVEDEPDFDKSAVLLDWYNSDLSLVINKDDFLSAQPLTMQGFGYVWHGVRATYGFTRGRIFYEVKVLDCLPVPHLEDDEQHPHVVRVGWSIDEAGLTLGEDPFSYGYGGTGKASTNLKFKDYGKVFGKGDVVGCYLDLEAEPIVMSFTVNGDNQGMAYEISRSTLGERALFPHIVTKNCSFKVNFGTEDPWCPALTRYTYVGDISQQDRVLGGQGPASREEAEEMEPSRFYSKATRSNDVIALELPYESQDEDSSDGEEPYQPSQDSDTSDESESEMEASGSREEDSESSKGNRKERQIVWKTVEIGKDNTEVPQWKGKLPEATALKTPLEYFKYFFDNDLLQWIVDQSNLYSTQQRGFSLNLTVEELEQFIGTVLYSTIFHLPRTRMYWQRACWLPQIAEVFSRNRWEEIKKYMHFNDNSNMPEPTDNNRDRLFKFRPLVDKLLLKFQAIPQQQMLCVDEQIVPFKGRSGLKQYNPKKPNKWGYKIFVLCDTNGLVHNFEIYTGKLEAAPELDLGASSNVVMRLASIIQVNMSHLLFFDNWFSSLKLVIELHKKGIYSLGTVRQNRLKGCRLSDDKRLKKLGRGTYDEKCATVEGVEVDVLKWCDTKCVTFISTYARGDPPGTVERWSKKDRAFVEVSCPNVVLEYNKFMGGVDLLDGLVAYYRTKLRSRKYYMRFFFHFLDMATVNSWLLYRRDGKSLEVPTKKLMDGLAFRSEVAEGLLKCKKDVTKKRARSSSSGVEKNLRAKKKKGRVAPTPTKDVRMDSVGHWPLPSDRQRCKFPGCKNKATIRCAKCSVHLCLNKKSNCFLSFHTQ